MPIKIEDGKGSGQSAQVKNYKLRTYSVVEDEQQHVNEDDGKMYSIIVDATTVAVNDQFFYIKNNSDDDLHITSMKGFVSADTEVKVLLHVTGTATSPNTITPVNRNAGSGKLLDATVQQGADLQMTGGDTVDLIRMDSTATGLFKVTWTSHIILPKNSTLCLESSAAAIVNLTISCFNH